MFHHFHNKHHKKTQGSISATKFQKIIKYLKTNYNLINSHEFYEKVINRKKLDDYAITGGHLSISGYKKLSDFISNEIFKKDTGIEK